MSKTGTSKLKALYIIDPVACRKKIIEMFMEWKGDMQKTAYMLGVHYNTIYRLFKKDEILATMIDEARQTLSDQGHRQIGWGGWGAKEGILDRIGNKE